MTDFDRFVADNAGTLLRSAYLITSDLHEAEDLVQEALHKIADRWPRVSRMDHPAAYARRIVVNLAIDGSARRTRRRRELIRERAQEPPHAPGAAGTPDGTAALDTHDELLAALATLPPRQRAALVLRYFLDLPEAEVAAAMGCSLGTVKSSTSRGLARLEQVLRPATQIPSRSILR